jgi:disulfide bond formation protein DsbB
MPAATDKIATGLAFVLGLVAIIGAWGSQVVGGLVPCELCLEQRTAYYWGLPVLALVLILWNRLPLAVWYVAMAIAAAIFAWGAYMGGFHAGVEWGYWPGPTACTGSGTGTSFGQLDAFRAGGSLTEHIVPCDQVQWRDPVIGLSLAGYNALVSAGIVLLLGIAVWWQAIHARRA